MSELDDMEKLLDEAIDREKVLEARVEELEAALRRILKPWDNVKNPAVDEALAFARRALEPREMK